MAIPKRILYLGLDPTHYSANGHVTHWPIIQIIPRPVTDPVVVEALHRFPTYTHVIITSKSTVQILNAYLPLVGQDVEQWKRKVTLAIGQVTAAHLQRIGIIPQHIAREETAEGIIHELQQLLLKDAHIFWPHSSQARPIIKDFLVKHRIRHTHCPLYDSQPRTSYRLPCVESFDEIVFTSPSTVDAFLAIFGQLPSAPCLVAIGPITARALKEKGYPVLIYEKSSYNTFR